MSILFGQGPNNQGFDEPTIIATIDPSNGNMFPIGQKWINTVSNEIFFLTSYSNGLPVWTGSVSGGAGIFADLTVNPGPTAITGEFRVVGDVDEAAVIRLQANGGATETIVIESVQGTGADSIQINSQAGGIEIATDAPAGDILVSSALGSIGIVAGEDVQDALIIQADGGTSTGLLIENTSGTGAGSAVASAIGILATDGSVYIESQDNAAGAIVLDASDAAGGIFLTSGTNGTSLTTTGDLDLTSSLGDVNIEATAGAVNFIAGGGVSWNVTGSLDLDATLSSHFTVTGAAQDLLLSSVGGSVNVFADEAAADAIDIDASAGGVLISADDDIAILSDTGDINLDSTLAAIQLTAATDIKLDPAATLTMAPTSTVTAISIGDITPTVGRTTLINNGAVNTAVIDLVSIAGGGVITDAGAEKEVSIATGTTAVGTTTVSIATGNVSAAGTTNLNMVTGNAPVGTTQVVQFGTGTGGGTKQINIGGTDSLTTINEFGVVGINATTGSGATSIGNTTAGGAVAINSLTSVTALGANVNVNNSGVGASTIGSTATGGAVAINSASTITALGTVNVNTSGTGATTIGSAGTGGAIALTTNTAIGLDAKTASHFTVTGAADLTLRSTAGAVVVSSAQAGANAIQLNCTDVAATISATMQAGSVVVSNTGKVTVTGDDLEVATAAKGVILGSGTKVIDGAGSPNASVTAAKGSLYLATNGSGVADRLYINTDGATAWTAITTVS